jgi:hypothetical protein
VDPRVRIKTPYAPHHDLARRGRAAAKSADTLPQRPLPAPVVGAIEQKNIAERVAGDLVSAIARAREIERRLLDFKDSGQVGRRLRHTELVSRLLDDLRQRCDAGQIEPGTVDRYSSALAHHLQFVGQDAIQRHYPFAVSIDRPFTLQFGAYLHGLMITPNGRDSTIRSHEGVAPEMRIT